MKGIVLIGADEVIESRAKGRGLPLEVVADISQATMPWEKTLIVQAGTRIPWDLLPAAWHFLDRWDAAVPLWRYGVLASDVGTASEREITRMIIRDLRVLLHSVELLFIRQNEAGQKLLRTWQGQIQLGKAQAGDEADQRLAFLRALYMDKPRLCVLPTTWLAEVQQWRGTPPVRATPPPRPLVTIEVRPGKFVKCAAGDEAKVRAAHNAQGDDEPMAVIDSNSFTKSTDKSRAAKGPLVKVQLPAGNWVKMYRADAVAQGLIEAPAESKAAPPQENKMVPPAGNKDEAGTAVADVPATEGAETAVEDMATFMADAVDAGLIPGSPDDLTHINGVGLATARLLNSHGIVTFAQLRAATDLSFLAQKQQDDIKAWRDNG